MDEVIRGEAPFHNSGSLFNQSGFPVSVRSLNNELILMHAYLGIFNLESGRKKGIRQRTASIAPTERTATWILVGSTEVQWHVKETVAVQHR